MGAHESKSAEKPVLEWVVGSGLNHGRWTDGPLHACHVAFPMALCQWGGSLLVAEPMVNAIRRVEGVLGVDDPLADSMMEASDFEACAEPLIMTVPGAQRARAIGGTVRASPRLRAYFPQSGRTHCRGCTSLSGLSCDGHDRWQVHSSAIFEASFILSICTVRY
jgi:hypothetical protein